MIKPDDIQATTRIISESVPGWTFTKPDAFATTTRNKTVNIIFNNKYASESASQMIDIRRAELKNQRWNRAKSQLLADDEGLTLSNDHWSILTYLRKRYLILGLPRHARQLSGMLTEKYAGKGGSRYLRRLFPGGPVSQGSRIANLRPPPNATDASHGSSY